MDEVQKLEMYCTVCNCVHVHKFVMDFGEHEVWQCDACDLREPRKKGEVQLQKQEPVAPAPIITKKVPSSSDPDVEYTLTKDSSGWRCDCQGFKYRQNCRHVKEQVKGERNGSKDQNA